jgi:serine/threonine-protein kinase
MSVDEGTVAVWREAFAAFERLSELDAESRSREMESLGRTRPDMHPCLVKLFTDLDTAHTDGSLIQGLASVASTAVAAGASRTGTVLGPYTLERLLGQGGMGEVWLAHRTDGHYEGTVAVKSLHPYLARPEMRLRFRREGQMVARLSHPHIARLFDAGASADGLLYMVFEYVQGIRIDEWCDSQRLDIPARVRLFLDVCEAVTHAHTHLIVHRDLKPANIMVTTDGQVKLLDFGIARLIEAETGHNAQTELTRLGGRALTPQYAAPEQVLGTAITTVTDVYSLGVLLYLLLCGNQPYGAGRSTPAQLERSIVETEPVPLTAATGAGNAPDDSSPSARAERRRTTPARLREALGGDLENIVGKALRKNPMLRYPSVMSLAEDLRRHLQHQPVQARPDAFAYRAAKFVRRHRGGVAVATALLLVIVAGVGGVVWQARAARAQAQRLERVKDLVISVFREQDPLARPGKDGVSPLRMIDGAISRADEELRGDPALHAELIDDLGEIQFNLGDITGAEATLRRAVAENRALYGPDSLQIAVSLRKLTWPLRVLNRHAEEIQVAEQALAILTRLNQIETLDAARVEQRLAMALAFGTGAPPRSLLLATDARRIFEARLGRNDPETIYMLFQLAFLEGEARRDAQAEALLREVIDRYEKHYGPNTVRLAEPLSVLASVLSRNDKPEESEALHRRAIALTRSTFGSRHQFLAAELLSLGNLYADTGQLELAESALREGAAAMPEGDDLQRMEQLKTLGRLHITMNRPTEAGTELHQAVELSRKSNGEARGFTWFLESEWGRALAAQGKLKEAEAIQRQALAKLSQIMGPDAYQNCLIADALADTLEKIGGNLDEVIRLRRRSLALTEKGYPRTSGLWAERASSLARALITVDTESSRVEALPLLDQAATDYHIKSSPMENVGETLLLRARLETADGKNEAARTDLREALDRLQHQTVAKPAEIMQARTLLRSIDPI